MDDVLGLISRIGLLPVIAIEDAEQAVPLVRALAEGGIPAAEVTFRTAAGEQAIREIAGSCPDILVGAGTVLNTDQCRRAVDAGARFIVSPGYNDEVVAWCVERGVPVVPGCANASDMTKAVNMGLEVVKFFPAETAGGISSLKALAPVFPGLRFVPTGGVNAKNLMDYLGYDRVIACGGTWMVKKDLINARRWDEITKISREAVRVMLGCSIHHVGINCEDTAQAEALAQTLCDTFGFEPRPGKSSILVGRSVECVRRHGPGEMGHIAIGVNDVDRAVFHLSRQGVRFDESTRKTDGDKTKAIYLAEEFGGFAVHLVKK